MLRTQRLSKLVFELRAAESRAVVTLFCENGLRKMFGLPVLEAEILQATVDKDSFPTCVIAEHSPLSKLLSSFHTTLSEVTLVCYPANSRSTGRAVQLRSFLDPQRGEWAGRADAHMQECVSIICRKFPALRHQNM